MTQISHRSRSQRAWFTFSTLALLSCSLPLLAQSSQPLPSPEAAIQQANQINPDELPAKLTSLEIDEITRDRLRFDPAWQPILKSVQQDIMILKWGDNHLENPVWRQYGPKAYPLLDYYARSGDPTRQVYGIAGIRSLGKPYSTLWLEKQLQRKAHGPDFYLLTINPVLLLDPNANAPSDYNWQRDFGLDDPQTRARLIQIARQNLEPPTSPNFYSQFNAAFLAELLGYEAVYPSYPSPSEAQPAPSIPEWNQWERIAQPTPAQVQQAVAFYRGQPRSTQDYILVNRLGRIKAGEISAFGKAFLQALAQDTESPDRIWAIAELDRHRDPQGSQQLQAILNGDLKPLDALTHLVSYDDGNFTPLAIEKAAHAYYLLIGMVQKYPDSRFTRAAREYGNLTGRSYFGGAPRGKMILDRIAQSTPVQRVASWQDWLKRYPDHPGADDASYFLARALQDQNQMPQAFDRWIALMTQPAGDNDARYLAWGHLRTLLDVGLSAEQLAQKVQQYQNQPIEPLLRYALAIHQARSQNYAMALQTSTGLDLTQMPESLLGVYYNDRLWAWSEGRRPTYIQKQMQALLTEQRQRWQRLQQLQSENTPEARYQLASDWDSEGGWKNGYLPVWDEARVYLLPTGDWDSSFCQAFWVCNDRLRGEAVIRSSYQQSSQNAVALSLYQNLLADSSLPSALREKVLFMSASAVLWQWEDFPLGETFRIHPLPGMRSSVDKPDPSPGDSEQAYRAYQARYKQLGQDYVSYLDQTIATLKQNFPQSKYIDDLLFSRYMLSGNPQDLQEIVQRYPQGDRAAEAQFLLAHRSAKPRETMP